MRYLFAITLMLTSLTIFSQTKKKLTVNDCKNWKYIKDYNISNNGNFIYYIYGAEKYSDVDLFIIDNKNNKTKKIPRGNNAKFSPCNNFIAFKISPQNDSLRKAKFNKVKKDKMPKDSLGIYIFDKDTTIKINKLLSFKMSKDSSSWIAYKLDIKPKTKKITEPKKKLHGKKLKKYIKQKQAIKKFNQKQKKQKGKQLVIFNPVKNIKYTFDNISEFTISRYGESIAFIKNIKDSIDTANVYNFNTKKQKLDTIFVSNGIAKNIALNTNGTMLAFTYSPDTGKTKLYSLKLFNNKTKKTQTIVDTVYSKFPKKWSVSNNFELYFSRNNKILYFGIAPNPKKEPKDTLIDEEKCYLDIWTYKDLYIQPEQKKNKKYDLKKTYYCDYVIDTKKINQLADTIIDDVYPHSFGNGTYAIGINQKPNLKSHSWVLPYKKDFYLINTQNGKKTFIDSTYSYMNISPNDKYVYWFGNDSSWYVQNIKTQKKYSITKNIKTKFYDEDNDVPERPGSYGIAGWTNDDKYILIYDKFDIWKISPDLSQKPINITNTRKQKIQNRIYKLNPDKLTYNTQEPLLAHTFNKINKNEGFKYIYTDTKKQKELINDKYSFTYPIKSKHSNKIIWRKSKFTQSPEIYYSNLNFKNITKLTNIDTTRQKYKWGNVKLIKWKNFKNDTIQGLLYTPEDLDTTKKYPMIVYFYEKYSDKINRFYRPNLSHSVINFPLFISNDYIIFIPDIKYYNTGTPGDDCYNSIVSGTKYLLKKYKFINKNKLGLQGQSWGGYQVAYLITKTNMYAAAMAGAPVSNMTSAYGGIRWQSGMSRMFQYETGQSRIGKTLWQNLDLYIKNSPVFFADKVNTPLLIMHNDNDGAVPWYQGIEYYMALRRLGKKVWLLDYNGESHNLRKWPNRLDISKREIQFFDYFLKDTKPPVWIDKGIPAIKKGKDFGFEIVK